MGKNQSEWLGKEKALQAVVGESDATPFLPTGIPLAVRSPYVSTWLWGGANDRGDSLTAQQPSFWNGGPLLSPSFTGSAA